MSLSSSSRQRRRAQPAFSPFGSLVRGRLNFSGSSAENQDLPLQQILGLISPNDESVLSRFTNNKDGFVASQINPFRENLERRLAQTETSLKRRNISGSSFGDALLTRENNTANRELQDATANALQNSFGFEQQLIQSAAGGAQSILSDRINQLINIANGGGTTTTSNSDGGQTLATVARLFSGFAA